MAPILSLLLDCGLIEARAEKQIPIFNAPIVRQPRYSAPESAMRKAAIDLALEERKGESKCICLLSGHDKF